MNPPLEKAEVQLSKVLALDVYLDGSMHREYSPAKASSEVRGKALLSEKQKEEIGKLFGSGFGSTYVEMHFSLKVTNVDQG